MFSYMSGFISDLNLEDRAEVYVFLLFPQKFVKYLKPELFRHMRFKLDSRYDATNKVYLDKWNSIHDHYIPFSLPIRSIYCRDTGICLKNETPVTKWIDKNFNVNLNEYLESISCSDRTYHEEVNDDTVIDENNLFKYVSIALEHVDFAHKVYNTLLKDKEIETQFSTIESLFEYHNVTLMQGLMLGTNPYIVNKNESKLSCEDDSIDVVKDVVFHSALEMFMININKVYKPSSIGSQAQNRQYFSLMHEARDCVFDKNSEC